MGHQITPTTPTMYKTTTTTITHHTTNNGTTITQWE
jgi:hypothetical protein